MNEQKAIESALKKVEAQQENFGFMKLFDVDEHWAVKEALKKQIPKKVNNLAGIDFCPVCGTRAIEYLSGKKKAYCSDCGQKLG